MRALATAIAIASRATTWPKFQLPLTTAVVSVSRSTSIGAAGRTLPSCTARTYGAVRITPCESWPLRFASTR